MHDIDKAAANVMNTATEELQRCGIPVTSVTLLTLVAEWEEIMRVNVQSPEDNENLEALRHAYDRLFCTIIGISY